jgi:hypothetical protein
MNIRPDSRTPRRFPQAMNQMNTRESQIRCGNSDGIAEVMAATPAAMDTATVNT